MKLYSIKPGLKKARKAANLTQQQLADSLTPTVSLKTVMNWEQGIVCPDLETIIQIADLLHCDIDFLTGRIQCQTHDLQFIHDVTGLSESAIMKLSRFQRDNKAHARADIVSILIEHFNAEYLINLIGQRISMTTAAPKDTQSMTPKELSAYANSITLKVDIDGRQLLVDKANFIDSQISTAVIRDLPEIVAAYNQQHDKTPVERADAFNDFRNDLIRQIETDRRAGTLDTDDETEYIRAAIDEYLKS